MRQRNRSSSLDGFVPGTQGRHVGFGSQPGRLDASQQVRIRRPGLHSDPRATRPSGILPAPQASIAAQRPQSHRRVAQMGGYNGQQTVPTSALPGVQPTGTGQVQRGRNPLYPQSPTSAPGGRQPRGRLGRNRKAAAGMPGAGSKRRIAWKKIFKRTALLTAVFLLVAGGWLGFKIYKNSAKVFGGDSNVLGFLNASKLKGEDKGRVNILLAGVSTDDPGHQGGNLTDSIMLISFDTINKKAVMLSIPRDMWVKIPGYGHSKINAANAYGDSDSFSAPGYPSGGMGLLEQVVSDNLEIPIHYYAKINYSAFRDAVNAVGGITVNIQSSDPRGLYDPNISKADNGPLKLPNGVQKLDGQTALNLARARGDPPGDGRYPYGFPRSDFDRTEHQRMMLLALKEKVISGGVITNPLKIGELFDVVGKNMKTDLEPSEIRRLYDLNKQVGNNNIQSLSLNDANGVNLLTSYTTPDGASALTPAAGVDDFSAINAYLIKAMSSDPVVQESAKIVVLNGGDTVGLATKYSNYLTSKGLTVAAVGDAPAQVGAAVIIDQTTNNAKPGTKGRLQQLFSGASVKTQAASSSSYPTADFVVVLGTSTQAPAGSSSTSD